MFEVLGDLFFTDANAALASADLEGTEFSRFDKLINRRRTAIQSFCNFANFQKHGEYLRDRVSYAWSLHGVSNC